MNDSLIKAKAKKDKKRPIRDWWRKNDYKVFRVILFPVYFVSLFSERHKDKTYEQMEFSSDVCKKYLDKVLPNMVAHYCEDAKNFLISSTDDMGDLEFHDFWGSYNKNKKSSRFFLKFDNQFRDYIMNEYQIDGYQKMTLTNWTHWDKAKEKFDWGGTPYNSDYAKGVIFYVDET